MNHIIAKTLCKTDHYFVFFCLFAKAFLKVGKFPGAKIKSIRSRVFPGWYLAEELKQVEPVPLSSWRE